MSYVGNKYSFNYIDSEKNKLIQFNRVLTAGQTVINNLTFVSGTEMVYINGVLLQQSDYSANGTTVTLGEPATEGDSFRLVGAGNYDLNSGAAGVIYDNSGSSLSGDSVQAALDELDAADHPLATAADSLDETNGTHVLTTKTMRSGFNASGAAPIYACRAWVNFDGTTNPPNIRGSGNVSSITDNGTGDFTINFSTALEDAGYGVVGTSNIPAVNFPSRFGGVTLHSHYSTGNTPSSCRVKTSLGSSNANPGLAHDQENVNVSIFR